MPIYSKPTFTDTIILYSSKHPSQHKYAAVRFLYNRLNTYQLHMDEYCTLYVEAGKVQINTNDK
jgi:hypothetical protein